MAPISKRAAWGWAWAGVLVGVAGCASRGPRTQVSSPTPFEGVITLDGDVSEWPAATVAWADQHHLYLRFSVEDESFTLQAAPQSLCILLDVDADAGTGQVLSEEPELAALGTDLEVQFSPPGENGPGRGVAMYAIAADGTRTKVDVYDWDFSCTPTYAGAWYEARLTRTPAGEQTLPRAGLLSTGALAGAVVLREGSGRIVGMSAPFRANLPVPREDGPRLSTLYVPDKEEGAVRVVSWNVLRGSPNKDPYPFARVFKAVKPDIVLVEEWEVSSEGELEAWFNTNLAEAGPWNVHCLPGTVQDGGGVGVVTRFESTALFNEPLKAGPEGKGVRAAGAAIKSPLGAIHAAAVHLKCCGTKDSAEDVARMAEAQAVNAAMSGLAHEGTLIRVIGGDFNLVGSRPPLDAMAAGLDADGSELEVAQPLTLGDRTYVTWSEKGNEFAPGRLDYVLVSGASASISRAFVLDATRLSEESLVRMGVERGDTSVSDHLPVVVDVRKRE